LLDAAYDVVEILHGRQPDIGVAAAVEILRLVEVLAGAEGPLARSGHHDRLDVVVRAKLRQHTAELPAHRTGPGVEPLGPVERDDRNPVVATQNEISGHRRTPKSGAADGVR